VPGFAFVLIDIVRVELPEPETLAGANDALVRAGKPLTLSATVPVNDPRSETVTVYRAVEFLAEV
jgi:hypothetical protein